MIKRPGSNFDTRDYLIFVIIMGGWGIWHNIVLWNLLKMEKDHYRPWLRAEAFAYTFVYEVSYSQRAKSPGLDIVNDISQNESAKPILASNVGVGTSLVFDLSCFGIFMQLDAMVGARKAIFCVPCTDWIPFQTSHKDIK